jgi:hypothetical protein
MAMKLLLRGTFTLTLFLLAAFGKRTGIAVMVLLLGTAVVSHGQGPGDAPAAPATGEETGSSVDAGGEVILHDTGEAGGGASSMDVGGGVILHDLGDGTTGTSVDVGDGIMVHETEDGRSGTSIDMGDGVIVHETEDGGRSISVDEGDGILLYQGDR